MRALAAIVVVLLAAAASQRLLAGDDATLGDGVATAGMERYEIQPGRGIGPVRIGMTRAAAEQAMKASGQAVDSFVRVQKGPPVLAMHGNAFQVFFDDTDRVEAVEVTGVAGDRQPLGDKPPFAALYRDVDVFRTRAADLVAVVSRDAPPDRAAAEIPGVTFEFPARGLSLWRQTEEETPYFETVSVARARR